MTASRPSPRPGGGHADTADPGRPVHLRWSSLGLVALGGAVGTGIREALALTWPAPAGGIPVTILLINVVGAFALGALLERLARRGPDEGRRRAVRLLVGTGVLGGFTTYGSLATDAAVLAGPALGTALAYAGLTLVAGATASVAGIAVGAALHRRTAAGRDAAGREAGGRDATGRDAEAAS
ncbi:camphor resistance protein CrcB [Clavibacter michiganensis]|uniref:Fluoride-specific ion channel FluC n=1 Tax=Clavibacter michiganensis TaxID=28447 RepID=A0A251XQR5_9MICO|nr:camphor resistance protein CrcB [Clavibacter michiganensis]